MSACILFPGAKNSKGYGTLTQNGRRVLAHRLAWETNRGPIPEGRHLHHTCGEPSCINVDHLEVVTPLRHNRTHVEGGALGDKIERLVAAWGPMRLSWMAHWLGEPQDHVAMAVRRSVKAGRMVRFDRGVYVRRPSDPRCPSCDTGWAAIKDPLCWKCGEPKWVLLRDLIEANR